MGKCSPKMSINDPLNKDSGSLYIWSPPQRKGPHYDIFVLLDIRPEQPHLLRQGAGKHGLSEFFLIPVSVCSGFLPAQQKVEQVLKSQSTVPF